MLAISDDDVIQVLQMKPLVEGLRKAFQDLAAGTAGGIPWLNYKLSTGAGQPEYMASVAAGALPGFRVAAMRYASNMRRGGAGQPETIHPGGRAWAFTVVFSLETGEPIAIFPDWSLSSARVAATTGVAIDLLARRDASVVAIIGSSYAAKSHLDAVMGLREVSRVRVYSPSREHRERFAKENDGGSSGARVEAVESPASAVRSADIVMCATSSAVPVFDGSDLEAGQFVSNISNSIGSRQKKEVDDETLVRSDLIVVNDRDQLVGNKQREVLDLVEAGRISGGKIATLVEVISGKSRGRSDPSQLIYYKNNSSLGIQDATVGAIIYEACRGRGLGVEVSSEWFGAKV